MKFIYTFLALFLTVSAFAADLDSSLWKNKGADPSWIIQQEHPLFGARKQTNKKVSDLSYDAPIVHPVNVFATILPVVRNGQTDGRGLSIKDANGVSYFMTLGDDYEAGIFSNSKPGKTVRDKYLTFIPDSDPFKMQLGVTYDVMYHVSPKLLMFHIKGPNINQNLKVDVNVAFPVTLNLVAQRSETVFSNVRVTSIENNGKSK